MEIYTTLKSDHKLIKQLLNNLEKTKASDTRERLELLKELKETLVPHARAEEKVLYDRLKKTSVKQADALAFEGYEEHAVVDHLIEQIESTPPNHKRWTALMSVVKENLEHHIEEEESELFKKAKKAFDHSLAVEMNSEFEVLKSRFLEENNFLKTRDYQIRESREGSNDGPSKTSKVIAISSDAG